MQLLQHACTCVPLRYRHPSTHQQIIVRMLPRRGLSSQRAGALRGVAAHSAVSGGRRCALLLVRVLPLLLRLLLLLHAESGDAAAKRLLCLFCMRGCLD